MKQQSDAVEEDENMTMRLVRSTPVVMKRHRSAPNFGTSLREIVFSSPQRKHFSDNSYDSLCLPYLRIYRKCPIDGAMQLLEDRTTV